MLSRGIKIDLTAPLILKLGAAVLSVWVWFRIWQFAMVVVVSVFAAVALEPAVRWLEGRKIPPGMAAFFPVLLITCAVTGFVWLGGSMVSQQAQQIAPTFAEMKKRAVESCPALQDLLDNGQPNSVSLIESYGMRA